MFSAHLNDGACDCAGKERRCERHWLPLSAGVREHRGLIAQSAEVCKREKVNVLWQLQRRGGGDGVLQISDVPTVKTEEGWNRSCCWGTSLQPLHPQQPLPGRVKHTPPTKEEILFYKDSADLPVTIPACVFWHPHQMEQVGLQERFTRAQVPRISLTAGVKKSY